MRWLAALLGASITVVGATWAWWPSTSSLAPPAKELSRGGATAPSSPMHSWPPPWPYASMAPAAMAEALDGAHSMGRARERSDLQAAPILGSNAEPVTPNTADLADPKAYLAFEKRATVRLYRSYIQAADIELPRLRSDIARARTLGFAPEQIAKAEAKALGIAAMRSKLVADIGKLEQAEPTH